MSREEEVLEVAGALFRVEGFRAVSLNRLCREAKIAKKTFYLLFRDKDALVDELVARAYADYARALREGPDDAPVDARLRVRMGALFTASAAHFSAPMLRDLAEHRPALWRAMEAARAALARTLVAEVRSGQESGLFRADVSADALAEVVDLVVARALDPRVLAARGLEPHATATLLFELLFAGLRADARATPDPHGE